MQPKLVPRGFDWNSGTNGCQVHLGPVNCGNGGSNGGGTNAGGGGANPAPGGTTSGPPIASSYCNIAACTYDFPTQTVSVVYRNASSKNPPGTPGQPVDIGIKESRCVEMRGTFIPPDANYSKFDIAIRGPWPIPPMIFSAPSDPATNSACGHHTVELVAIIHGSLCGCRKSFPPP